MVNDKMQIQIKSGAIKSNYLMLSGHRLGRFKANLEQITDFLNQNFYLLIAVPYYANQSKLGKTHIYQIFYIDTKILQIDNYKKWQEIKGKKGGVSYHAINKYGVEASISPSMSWQIWWKIPLDIILENDKTRIISIK